jgi:hypothetical protein
MKRNLIFLVTVFCFSMSGLVLAGEIKIYSSEGVRTIIVPGEEKDIDGNWVRRISIGDTTSTIKPVPKETSPEVSPKIEKNVDTRGASQKKEGLDPSRRGWAIETQNGKFHPAVRGGNINLDTGEFYPRVD